MLLLARHSQLCCAAAGADGESEGEMTAKTVGRRDLVMLLLGVDARGEESEGLGGITRMQKLLFLLEREDKAGPYSAALYDDLQFLENLGLVQTEVTSEATEAESAELDLLSFDELIDGGAESEEGQAVDGMAAADAHEERRYRLTPKGMDHVRKLLGAGMDAARVAADGIRRVKSRYSELSLSDLLYYVYTKYPEMAVESEIRDQVMRRARR